jgi:hypothetical protein
VTESLRDYKKLLIKELTSQLDKENKSLNTFEIKAKIKLIGESKSKDVEKAYFEQEDSINIYELFKKLNVNLLENCSAAIEKSGNRRLAKYTQVVYSSIYKLMKIEFKKLMEAFYVGKKDVTTPEILAANNEKVLKGFKELEKNLEKNIIISNEKDFESFKKECISKVQDLTGDVKASIKSLEEKKQKKRAANLFSGIEVEAKHPEARHLEKERFFGIKGEAGFPKKGNEIDPKKQKQIKNSEAPKTTAKNKQIDEIGVLGQEIDRLMKINELIKSDKLELCELDKKEVEEIKNFTEDFKKAKEKFENLGKNGKDNRMPGIGNKINEMGSAIKKREEEKRKKEEFEEHKKLLMNELTSRLTKENESLQAIEAKAKAELINKSKSKDAEDAYFKQENIINISKLFERSNKISSETIAGVSYEDENNNDTEYLADLNAKFNDTLMFNSVIENLRKCLPNDIIDSAIMENFPNGIDESNPADNSPYVIDEFANTKVLDASENKNACEELIKAFYSEREDITTPEILAANNEKVLEGFKKLEKNLNEGCEIDSEEVKSLTETVKASIKSLKEKKQKEAEENKSRGNNRSRQDLRNPSFSEIRKSGEGKNNRQRTGEKKIQNGCENSNARGNVY